MTGESDEAHKTKRPWKIVILEDDALQLKVLNHYLAGTDYIVHNFRSAATALEHIPTIAPDMILLDVNLEDSNGLEISRQLKENPCCTDVPIIFVTGANDPQDIVRGFEAGAVDYIGKPVHKQELLARLQTHLSVFDLQHQLKKQVDLLAESENRFRSLFEYAFIGIIILDEHKRIIMANSQAEQMFKYTRDELINQPLDILIPQRYRKNHIQHCQDFSKKFMSRTMGVGKCFPALRKDGTELDVEIGLSIIRSKYENITMCYIIDVTKRKLAEDERDALEKALRKSNENLEQNVLERTRQLEEAQAKLLAQQRLQQEIELAAQVQSSLLPHQMPQIDGFEFSASATPAHYVSGDLYDFILTSPQNCYVVLADISGKGVPSALLNSTAHTLVRAESRHESSPAVLLKNVNDTLFEDLSQVEMFITFFVAHLDNSRRKLIYANAGHTEFIWWEKASRKCRLVPSTGIPIGIFADLEIEEMSIALRPGDIFVFYSDGITEATNPAQELFGIERLIKIVCEHAESSAQELSETILQSVKDFQNGTPPSDDLTLIVLKIKPFTIEREIAARIESLDDILAMIREAMMGYPQEFSYQFELGASEILTNILSHAYDGISGTVRINLSLDNETVQLDLYDDGKSFEPSQVPYPDFEEAHEGGYGLYIVHQVVDELVYEPDNGRGNHWMIKKRCSQAAGHSQEDEI